MSLIDEDSVDRARSGVELFEIQPTQTSIEESRFEHFYPLTTLDRGGPVEFKVSLGEDENIDTNETFLYLKATIVDAGGKPMAAALKAGETIPAKSVVFPINYFIGSCFRQIEVSLNSKPIGGNEGIHYRAYMETLLSYGAEAKSNQLVTSMYYQDVDEMDVHGATVSAETTKNKGAISRFNRTKFGKRFECDGRIHSEIFEQKICS